jgi:hypothetical protein
VSRFGNEDEHFVIELTYNYNVGSYALGNDLLSITVMSSEALARAEKDKDLWNLMTEQETGDFFN